MVRHSMGSAGLDETKEEDTKTDRDVSATARTLGV